MVAVQTSFDVEARWRQVEAMAPVEWAKVAARISTCVVCFGPALLTEDELAMIGCAPRCRYCKEPS